MKRFCILSLIVSLFLTFFLCSKVRANYIDDINYGSPTVDEGIDSQLQPGQDILYAWHVYDSGYHYFRIDLRGEPSGGIPPNNAGLYGIYIDSLPGGGSGLDTSYVPYTLSGIDYIVDSHFQTEFGGWWQDDYHIWNGSAYDLGTPPVAQQSENSGITLEWKVAAGDIGTAFTWWAATHDIGSEVDTYDMTGPQTVVPIPTAIWLLGSGLVGLIGFRRKFKI